MKSPLSMKLSSRKLSPGMFAALALAVPLCLAQSVVPPGSVSATGAGTQPSAEASRPRPSTAGTSGPDAADKRTEVAEDVAGKPYVIGPLDVLDIRVWNDPKLSGAFAVRPDGLISMPLIGDIKADGLTLPELNKAITGKLTTLMNDPEVNIQLGRINSKKYYIFGEVARQGEFPLIGDMTVLDGFANCGGFKDFANPKKIYILRDNGKQRLKFNYKDVSHGRHMEQNVLLQSGDRIFVP